MHIYGPPTLQSVSKPLASILDHFGTVKRCVGLGRSEGVHFLFTKSNENDLSIHCCTSVPNQASAGYHLHPHICIPSWGYSGWPSPGTSERFHPAPASSQNTNGPAVYYRWTFILLTRNPVLQKSKRKTERPPGQCTGHRYLLILAVTLRASNLSGGFQKSIGIPLS